MKNLEPGKVYKFQQLELYMSSKPVRGSVFLRLRNETELTQCIMHVFPTNFCGDWKAGDGILFYENSEAHSASHDDEFRLIEEFDIRDNSAPIWK